MMGMTFCGWLLLIAAAGSGAQPGGLHANLIAGGLFYGVYAEGLEEKVTVQYGCYRVSEEGDGGLEHVILLPVAAPVLVDRAQALGWAAFSWKLEPGQTFKEVADAHKLLGVINGMPWRPVGTLVIIEPAQWAALGDVIERKRLSSALDKLLPPEEAFSIDFSVL